MRKELSSMRVVNEMIEQSIILSPIVEQDLPHYITLYQDPEFMDNFGSIEGVEQTKEQLWEWFLGLHDRHDECVYSIFEKERHTWVGFVTLMDIDEDEKEAWIVIGLDSQWRNKGFGTQALKAIIKIAFIDLKLNVLKLSVLGENERAMHVYEKMGFKVELIYPRLQVPNIFDKDIIQYQLAYTKWDQHR